MMKKVLLVFTAAATLLLCSCGSKKAQENPLPAAPELSEEVADIETEAETEAMAETDTVSEEEADEPTQSEVTPEETNQEEPTQTEATSDQSDTEAAEESETSETQNDVYNDYPPLDEIEEPELIELTPEEIEKALQTKGEDEKIIEPVTEIEGLPPLSTEENPISDDLENSEAQEALEEETTEEAEEPEEEIIITPSRSVSLKKGETLSITYPGSGWIYMGSTSEYNNLTSKGRKLGTTDTKYTLVAKEPGTQLHHFYKVDNLTGEYIDDYIEVTVLNKKGSSSTIIEAPAYVEVVPKKPEVPAKSSATKQKEITQTAAEEEKTKQESKQEVKQETKQESKPETKQKSKTEPEASNNDDVVVVVDEDEAVIVIDEAAEDELDEQIIDLSGLIEEAKTGIKSKKYGDAYTALSQYLEYSTDGRDEALYLMGQILESDSKFRNIKEAVNTYQQLCDNYPASEYWDSANKRIIYLKRFYINIH